MHWEAWRLAARSRVEDAVKGRISSIRRSLRKGIERLEELSNQLKSLVREASDLLSRVGEVERYRHKLAPGIGYFKQYLLELLKQASEELSALDRKRTDIMGRLKHIEDLMNKALREAAAGSVDRAHELSLRAAEAGGKLLAELELISFETRELLWELGRILKQFGPLVKRVESDMRAVAAVGLTLDEDEVVRLVEQCRIGGIGPSTLIITNKRLLLAGARGGRRVEVPRNAIRHIEITKRLFGLRRSLLLILEGPGGSEQVIRCDGLNREALEEMLEELSPEGQGS